MNLCVLGKNEGFKCQNVSACLLNTFPTPLFCYIAKQSLVEQQEEKKVNSK